jgi:chromate transporter
MTTAPSAITLPLLFRAFFRIGCLSFGGPAGQIALMHREIVDDRGWVDEGQYLRALNFCHLLPGPEAQQLATWIGWRLHGVTGGLIAGLLFVLPGALVMLGLTILYLHAAGEAWFTGLFLGIKAAVLAIVAQAVLRIAGRALKGRVHIALAIAAFAALALFNLPFPLVLLAAAIFGAVMLTGHHAPMTDTPPTLTTAALAWRTLRTILIWGAIWAAPLALVWVLLGPDHRLAEIGAFFSRLAVVTFGGAYAVLAYMAQEAVNTEAWLNAGEMADGLGLAETTPGPLIMVTQFVGTLAAVRAPEPLTPMLAGLVGAALTTWVTFAPSFLMIFALAPWIERLERAQRLQGALAGITAAVVGVIANLALWFALHLIFADVTRLTRGPLDTAVPDLGSFDTGAAALTLGALLLTFRFKLGTLPMLCITGGAGLALQLAFR